jgi:hypothetical protein
LQASIVVSTTGNRILRGPGRARGAFVAEVGTVLVAVTLGAQAALASSNVSAGTKSFARLAYDRDAPTGGELMAVVHGRTDFGTGLYGR